MDDVAYVDPSTESSQKETQGFDLDDPRDENGGSVWGPDSTQQSDDSDGW
jgi:hypothetical protein